MNYAPCPVRPAKAAARAVETVGEGVTRRSDFTRELAWPGETELFR